MEVCTATNPKWLYCIVPVSRGKEEEGDGT